MNEKISCPECGKRLTKAFVSYGHRKYQAFPSRYYVKYKFSNFVKYVTDYLAVCPYCGHLLATSEFELLCFFYPEYKLTKKEEET